MNTHTNKAKSYDIGRVDYPKAFFNYLYNEIGVTKDFTIADIGAGTGKITKRFLERGNKVFALEPDKDMMEILKGNLSSFTNCNPIDNTAEGTGLLSDSVDLIFCGNSYMWFDRSAVILEFQRIVRNCGKSQNIMITRLAPSEDVYSDEFLEIDKKFKKSVLGKVPNNSPPFQESMYENKTFEYVVYQSFDEFLHGCLSASYAPNMEDDSFNEYCLALKGLFDKYSIDGKIEAKFKLYCMAGCVENLV